MMPVLGVRGLKVSIRTDEGMAEILDDVGLELERGRILGVVGESGCGKSTLIRAIMGILPDPETALERYPHQFSGGQRQRLLIAAALACAPGLVIADEPTTALDVTTQHQILLLLRELVAEFGISLMFVTHDFGVVAELCDDLCVIYAGQTVERGPVGAVLEAPSHPYTRALLACHPDRATSFVGIPGSVPSPLARPAGCLFAPRCADVRPLCCTDRPPQGRAGSGAEVRCVQFP